MARRSRHQHRHGRGKSSNAATTGKLTQMLGGIAFVLVAYQVVSVFYFHRASHGYSTASPYDFSFAATTANRYSYQLWSSFGNMTRLLPDLQLDLPAVPDLQMPDFKWTSFLNKIREASITATGSSRTTMTAGSSSKPNILPLEELVNRRGAKSIACPPPLVPFQDVVLPPNPNLPKPLIPRIMHVTFKHRCLPQDLAYSLDQWKSAMPDYSIYFHDDTAVDKLIHSDWPEFPMLHQLMQCVRYRGAMKIDIWRLLIVYRYGGVYTDIDNWPQPKFRQDIIRPTDSAFMFSDANFRPTQWFFAMESNHPLAYFCMLTIFDNLLNLPNIATPNVVSVTGPNAVHAGIKKYLTEAVYDTMQNHEITVVGPYNKTIHKIPTRYTEGYIKGSLGGHSADMIEYNGTQMTRRDRMELQSGVIHWDKIVYWNRFARRISCQAYLLEQQLNQTFTRPKQP